MRNLEKAAQQQSQQHRHHSQHQEGGNQLPEDRQPFFLWLGTPAAHANFIPAPQHWPSPTATEQAPRTPNFNTVCDHCHDPLPSYPAMTPQEVNQTDDIFRRRLGTLQSVDDLIAAVFQTLDAVNETDNTFVFYTGDVLVI